MAQNGGFWVGRVWCGVALALLVGAYIALRLQLPRGGLVAVGCVLAALTWLLLRRGRTLVGPLAGWWTLAVCFALWVGPPLPPAQIPAKDLALSHRPGRLQLLTADGSCRLFGDRISWRTSWRGSCSLGPSARCEPRSGTVWLRGASVQLSRGQSLRVIGAIRPAHGFRNFGADGRLRATAERGVVGSITPMSRGLDAVDADPPKPRVFGRFATITPSAGAVCRARQTLSVRLEKLVGPPGHGLPSALVLGNRGFLDPKLVDALRLSGTAHLLAVSGTHVGLVVGAACAVLLFGLRRLPTRWLRRLRPRPIASSFAVLVGWAYV